MRTCLRTRITPNVGAHSAILRLANRNCLLVVVDRLLSIPIVQRPRLRGGCGIAGRPPQTELTATSRVGRHPSVARNQSSAAETPHY